MNNRPQLFARLILAGLGLLMLTLAFSFAGCAVHRAAPEESAAPMSPASMPEAPPRPLLGPARAAAGLPAALVPRAAFGRVGRKATINIYYAPATVVGKNATAAVGAGAKTTVAGKRANQATDSATQQVATNAVAGHGNTATQTATVKPAPDWRSTLLRPLGWVLALAVVAGAGYFLWPLIVRRRTQV